jgi:DNA-binding HxlR family transcriptional regulator
VLKLVSRFTDTPDEIAVELGESGWRSLGTVSAAVRKMRQGDVLGLVAEEPLTREQLVEAAAGRLSEPTLRRRLGELVERALVARIGEGTKGDPYRWQLTEAGLAFRVNFLVSPILGVSGDPSETQHPSGFQPSEKPVTGAGGLTPRAGDRKPDDASICVVCDAPYDPDDEGATRLRCPDCAARSQSKGNS